MEMARCMSRGAAVGMTDFCQVGRLNPVETDEKRREFRAVCGLLRLARTLYFLS
jgi:hypothetical protein